MSTYDTLAQRGKRYGNYLEQTEISSDLLGVIEQYVAQRKTSLASDQSDALAMIAVKIARIINGDPDYVDNWEDIAGYATLVAERLQAKDE